MASAMLTELPSDVFTALMKNVDNVDLCNLRLTNNVLHTIAVTEEFRSRFRHVRIGFSTKDLDIFTAVCHNPQLREVVESITIVAEFYDLKELNTQLEEGKKWDRSGNGPIFCAQQRKLSNEEMAEVGKNVELLTALRDDQAALMASGAGEKALIAAFRQLGQKRVSIRIDAVVGKFDTKQSFPCRSVSMDDQDARKFSLSHIRPPFKSSFRVFRDLASASNSISVRSLLGSTFKSTMAVISCSDLTITSLSVYEMEHGGGSLPIAALHDSLTLSSPTQLQLPHQLEALNCLSLNISPPPLVEIDAEAGAETRHTPVHPTKHASYLTALASLVSPLRSLTKLDIRFKGFTGHSDIDCSTIFSHLAGINLFFPNLGTLNLRGPTLQVRDLLTILRACPQAQEVGLHRVTLPESVTDKKVTIRTKAAWVPFFSAFLSSADPLLPKLQRLSISAFYTSRIIFPTYPNSALQRSKDEMKDDPGESYKLQAYQEGNPCVNFTRDELCCAPPPPKPASSTRAKTLGAAEYADAGDEEENIDTEPTEDDPNGWYTQSGAEYGASDETGRWLGGVRYRVSSRRPLGSPWLYRWMEVGRMEWGEF